MESEGRMSATVSNNDFQVSEADTDPDLRLLETVSLRVEPSKSVSRSMVSLESVPNNLVEWPASRLRLYSFPWRRRSTASHILTHQVLRIRRRFRWEVKVFPLYVWCLRLKNFSRSCANISLRIGNVATNENYQFRNCKAINQAAKQMSRWRGHSVAEG